MNSYVLAGIRWCKNSIQYFFLGAQFGTILSKSLFAALFLGLTNKKITRNKQHQKKFTKQLVHRMESRWKVGFIQSIAYWSRFEAKPNCVFRVRKNIVLDSGGVNGSDS